MAILGAPVALAAAASWTYATIIYKIEVDLYHLTKESYWHIFSITIQA